MSDNTAQTNTDPVEFDSTLSVPFTRDAAAIEGGGSISFSGVTLEVKASVGLVFTGASLTAIAVSLVGTTRDDSEFSDEPVTVQMPRVKSELFPPQQADVPFSDDLGFGGEVIVSGTGGTADITVKSPAGDEGTVVDADGMVSFTLTITIGGKSISTDFDIGVPDDVLALRDATA